MPWSRQWLPEWQPRSYLEAGALTWNLQVYTDSAAALGTWQSAWTWEIETHTDQIPLDSGEVGRAIVRADQDRHQAEYRRHLYQSIGKRSCRTTSEGNGFRSSSRTFINSEGCCVVSQSGQWPKSPTVQEGWFGTRTLINHEVYVPCFGSSKIGVLQFSDHIYIYV